MKTQFVLQVTKVKRKIYSILLLCQSSYFRRNSRINLVPAANTVKKQVLVCLITKYIYNIPADQYINSILVFYYQWHSQDIAYAKAQHGHTTLVRTSALSAEAFRRVWGHPPHENLGILQPPRSVLRS